ncbi:hypothetical protein BCR34DRAFT_580320 [Clohesyomyces aquaticus]|uniref:Secreted protein n=1 Tax=Clohesyomyces aquaticus TaxID=1231657 RepID=A0A1Y1Y784_9PLEO|nr:hypothetical protein BCR34DRAFT_580320 [Clohesyomyces aquaticus]
MLTCFFTFFLQSIFGSPSTFFHVLNSVWLVGNEPNQTSLLQFTNPSAEMRLPFLLYISASGKTYGGRKPGGLPPIILIWVPLHVLNEPYLTRPPAP